MTSPCLLRRCLSDTRGATAIEYALLAALIAGVIIGAVGVMGRSVADLYGTVGTALEAEIARPAAP